MTSDTLSERPSRRRSDTAPTDSIPDGEQTLPAVEAEPVAGSALHRDEVLAGRFRIIRFIARGGMGEVYEAEDQALGVRVALKVLPSKVASSPEAVERLKREIQLARQVTHRNVCRIFDVVQDRRQREDGSIHDVFGLTMELLQGETLTSRLTHEGALSPEQALPLVRQMAMALNAAHRAGIVHRDFKSRNVMLVDEPGDGRDGDTVRLVVTDFGVAHPVRGDDQEAGEQGLLAGTPEYMAPEQAEGSVTPACDIYALGIVIYEMMTGTRPYSGGTPLQELLQRSIEVPPSPRILVPDLDPRWEAAIMRCLAHDPAERFPSAVDLVLALLPHGEELSIDDLASDSRQRIESRLLPAMLRRPLWLLLGMAAMVVFIVAVVRLWQAPPSPAPPGALAPVQLTTWQGLEVDPCFAPDGNAIVFSSNRSGRFEIYRMDLAAPRRELQLTHYGAQCFQPAWSPDGSTIAYADHGRQGIWLIPASGGEARQLTDFGSHPAWSPDGSLIAFQSDTSAELSANASPAMPPSTLWLVPAGGGSPVAITRPGEPPGGHGAPEWSRDGSCIVFNASDRRWSQIWTVNIDDGRLWKLVHVPPVVFDPALSPDGRFLYYSAVSEGERYAVWRLQLDPGSVTPVGTPVSIVNLGMANIRQFAVSQDGTRMIHTALATVSNIWSLPLTPGTGVPSGTPRPLTSGSGRNSRPVFSPDGGLIAFDRWHVGANQDIWFMGCDGTAQQQLTIGEGTETQASWLPDGNAVAYLSDRGGTWAFWVSRRDEDRPQRLSRLEAGADGVRLSPDGKRIAFHAQAEDGSVNIRITAIDSAETRQLTFDRELMGYPCWSPDGTLLAFEMKRGEDDHVAFVPSLGCEPVQLSFSSGKSWPYSWSPDGDRIVFAGLRDGFWNLWWVSLATGEQRKLTDYELLNGYVRYPSWSPRDDQVVFELAETTGDLWLVEHAQPY